ncbi:MAG: hypothetical protein OJF51_004408 [Nitrospira sp.]|jgi:hypothetical protein|nr:MAG: hypothetical protein OJF51_004408 [Nitrospira sp.]
MRVGCASHQGYKLIIAVAFLCMCVLGQMLGMPVTLIGLLTSSDVLAESVSEDFSLTPVLPEPEMPGSSRIHAEVRPSFYLPVFVTSVFHPPQT